MVEGFQFMELSELSPRHISGDAANLTSPVAASELLTRQSRSTWSFMCKVWYGMVWYGCVQYQN